MDTDTFRTEVRKQFPNACFLVNSFPNYSSWSCGFELPGGMLAIHCAQTWSITFTIGRSDLKFKGQGTTLQEAIENAQNHMEDSFSLWRDAFKNRIKELESPV